MMKHLTVTTILSLALLAALPAYAMVWHKQVIYGAIDGSSVAYSVDPASVWGRV